MYLPFRWKSKKTAGSRWTCFGVRVPTQNIGLSNHKLKSALTCTVWSQCTPVTERHIQCCRTRNCGWAADLARGREWTQKFWRQFTWILNCLIMCQSKTRPKYTILSQKIKTIWPVSLTKNSGSAPGAARKTLQRGRKVTKHGTGQTDRRTDEHHGNNATIRSNERIAR